MNPSFELLNQILRDAIREETPAGSGGDLSTVEELLTDLRRLQRQTRNLQRQTRNDVRDALAALLAQTAILERIATATESIDAKTKRQGRP